jgi:hypothetical protein
MTDIPESPKPHKRPRASTDLSDSLMCLICTDFFKPPVVQCLKGHSYCHACVSRMSSSKGVEKLCAMCRSPIVSGLRNYAIEEVLSKFTIGCTWASRGCKQQVVLNHREEHELSCEFRPLVECYFREVQNCLWKGNQEDLANHIIEKHEVQELSRNSLFRYLWNPPNENVWRFRFRVLKQVISADSEPFVFILEHYYEHSEKFLCFLLRSICRDVRKRYRISILNRKNEANRIMFEGLTSNFEEFGHISNFMSEDLAKVFIIPYAQLREFCFYCEEDKTSYFSLHVEIL